jgi:hypothetical protein
MRQAGLSNGQQAARTGVQSTDTPASTTDRRVQVAFMCHPTSNRPTLSHASVRAA